MLMNRELFVSVLLVGAATVAVHRVVQAFMFHRGLRTAFFRRCFTPGARGSHFVSSIVKVRWVIAGMLHIVTVHEMK